MIDIGKFAKPHIIEKWGPDGHRGQWRFGGTDTASLAAEIHAFADRVATSDILVQRIQAGQIASADEYFTQALLIEFAEVERLADAERMPPERIIELPRE